MGATEGAKTPGHNMPPSHTTPQVDIPRAEMQQAISHAVRTESEPLSMGKTICVDPRQINPGIIHPTLHRTERKHVYSSDGVARAGADEGYVLAVSAAFQTLSGERAQELVYDWTVSRGRDFTMHADDQGHGLGCKHVGNALAGGDFEHATHTSAAKVTASLAHLHTHAATHGEHPNIPVLTAPHSERWVVISDMPGKTIPSRIAGTDGFRYNRAVDYDRLQDLAEYLTTQPDSEFTGQSASHILETLQAESDRQTFTTLLSINPDLPVFVIDAHEEVTYAGTVRELVQQSQHTDLLTLDILPKAH